MPTILTNGITTHYDQEGQGPPVVLIHGSAFDRRMWTPQAAALAAAGYRVIRYDLRGHGASDVPATGYTYADYSADLRDLLNRLAIDRAHLVGFSLGGGIALTFVADHPIRVASLTLISPALPGFTYSDEFAADIERLRAAVRSEGPAKALERHWLAHPIFASIRRHADQLALVKEMVLAHSGAPYLDEAEYPPPRSHAIEHLSEITAPTLVISGALDLPDFRLVADLLAENIADCRRLIAPDAGHVVGLEQPDLVNEALLAFLLNLTGRR